MKMQPADVPFLKGEKFSNGLIMQFDGKTTTSAKTNRLEYLCNLVKGKRVLHIGCVDHMPLIAEKRAQGQWLHELLVKSATFCAGMDINAEGIAYLREARFKDIYCVDIINDPIPEGLSKLKFDYLVLGEMIEHVDNPVEFLTSVRKKFSHIADVLVVTTPNAFRFQNIVNTLRGREGINSDHRYWFTPYTLVKILNQAGYDDMDVDTVWYSPLHGILNSSAKTMIGSMLPLTKDCLVAQASFRPKIETRPSVSSPQA